MKENKYYVYELIDPRTNQPFYVGKGSGNRDLSHFKEAKWVENRWINKIKCQIINNIELSHRQVTIKRVKRDLFEDEAYQLEVELIKKYGKIIDGSGILSNIADGGGLGNTNGRTVQSYTVSGSLVKSYKNLDYAAADVGVHKSTICAALNGRAVTAGGYRWAYDGEPVQLSPHGGRVPVSQFNIEGKLLKDFDSIQSAAKEIGIIFTSIVGCCRGSGNNYTAGGYRWAYKNELPFPLPINYKYQGPNRVLHALNKEGKVVGKYPNVKEAITDTNANPTGISDCCSGRKKTSGGLKWIWINP